MNQLLIVCRLDNLMNHMIAQMLLARIMVGIMVSAYWLLGILEFLILEAISHAIG